MSPRSAARPPMPSAVALADRLAAGVGAAVRDERSRRALTTRQLAERARVSPSTVNAVESGQRASLDVYARVATALGLSLHMAITDGRRRQAREPADLVHAAMGELEASFLAARRYVVAVDHPYQHYQFAGRADVMAWSTDQPAALLHLENRTRFPRFPGGRWCLQRQVPVPGTRGGAAVGSASVRLADARDGGPLVGRGPPCASDG